LKTVIATVLLVTLTIGCGKRNHASADQVSLADLNRALAAMNMRNASMPQSVYELTNFPTIQGKTLPKPPPGKKLAIDFATRR
jgi:hypothetical protein